MDQLLLTKPAIIQDNNYLNKIYDQIAASPNARPTLTAVHITNMLSAQMLNVEGSSAAELPMVSQVIPADKQVLGAHTSAIFLRLVC